MVVKVGSSLVTAEGRGIDQSALNHWAQQIAALKQQGIQIIFVSSGAIAEGLKRLGWLKRPKAVNELQAAAAVGQMASPKPMRLPLPRMIFIPHRYCSPTTTSATAHAT